jgi:hypothetical protein
MFCTGIEFLFNPLCTLKDRLLERGGALCNRSVDTRSRTPSLHLVNKNLRALSLHEEQGGGHLSFGRLLDIANAAISRDVRDKVYGSVGTVDSAIAKQLVPDYRMDPAAIQSVPSTFLVAEPQFRERGWRSMAERKEYYYRWEWWRLTNQDFHIGDQLLHDYFTDRILSKQF